MWDVFQSVGRIAKGAISGSSPSGNWWLLRRQLVENARNARSAAIGNIVNAVISTALYWNNVPLWAVTTFWTLMTVLITWRLNIAQRLPHAGRNADKLIQLRKELIGNATGLGLTWGFAVKAMFVWGDAQDHWRGDDECGHAELPHTATRRTRLCLWLCSGCRTGAGL
jgi:hypothetical protein